MSSPGPLLGADTMPPAHDAAASSEGGPGDNEVVQPTTFVFFPLLPQETQDLIWKKALLEQDQPGINFIQLYTSKNRQGQEMSEHVRINRHSVAAYLARMKRTCKGFKMAIERHVKATIANGEQFQSITVSGRFGEAQAQVKVNDIIFFGSLHKPYTPFDFRTFPTDRGCIAEPRSIFEPANQRVPSQWSWIRRVAMSYPLNVRDAEHFALAGCDSHSSFFPQVCHTCIAWNLSGLRNLEEIFFIVEGLDKPTGEKVDGLVTKISPDLYNGGGNSLSNLNTRCGRFCFDTDDEDEDDEDEEEMDTSMETYKGSYYEYYQVLLGYEGSNGYAHHSLRHFARAFGRSDNERVRVFNEAPRANNVVFKLLSYTV